MDASTSTYKNTEISIKKMKVYQFYLASATSAFGWNQNIFISNIQLELSLAAGQLRKSVANNTGV